MSEIEVLPTTPRFGDATARQARLITISYWSSTLAEGASRIIIPLHLAAVGVSAAGIGLAFLVFELFGLAANLFSGLFINRYGYRRSLVVSLSLHSLASVGYLALLLAPDQVWFTLVVVNSMRALRGVGKELIKTTSSAYFKHLDSGVKSRSLAVQVLLGGKDSTKGVGLLVGGVLLSLVGFQGSFLILGLFTLVCLAVTLMYVGDHREEQRVDFRHFLEPRPKLTILGIARAFLYGGRDLWLVVAVPLHLAALGYSDVTVGATMAAGMVVFGVTQPLTDTQVRRSWRVRGLRVKRRWRYRSLGAAMPLLMAVAVLFTGTVDAATSPVLFVAMILVYNLLGGIATVPHNRLHLSFARRRRTAVDIAYYKTVAQLGKVAAVPLSGVLYGLFGLRGCLFASAASLVASSVCGTVLVAQKRTAKPARASRTDDIELIELEPREEFAKLDA